MTLSDFKETSKENKYHFNQSPAMNSEDSITSSTASSSVISSASMEEDRDSCYYPDCRKDTNCNCKMCLASISATLDLLPMSVQKSTLTKLSESRPSVKTTPLSFDSSTVSTPKSHSFSKMESPLLKSAARVRLNRKKERKKIKWASFFWFLKLVSGLSLFYAVEIGFSWGVSGVLRSALSIDHARGAAERSLAVKDLSGRLRFLENELKGFVVDGKIASCSNMDSMWKVNKDGEVLNSRCVLYKSAVEELSIWGWPLQTAGFSTTGFSSRTFFILSGRVTEWSEGKIRYSIRKAGSSWVQSKWSSSVIQLDSNTWILEYERSSMLEDSNLVLSLLDLFKRRVAKSMKQVSLFHSFEFNTEKNHIKVPT